MDSANNSMTDFTNVENLTQKTLNSSLGCMGTVLPSYAESWRPLHWYPERLDDRSQQREAHNTWKIARAANERPPWVAEENWTGW